MRTVRSRYTHIGI